ncbi:MAG: ribosomal protein S18-alanine N-acetyltransferase [Aliidiomarina sp.]|uniref:ribosomal protein S18-alanine N-acetyltransferase n=1 Tax=Aliidiomarina sp. TaxID=1872439 RepID=UPI0025BD3E09|nr:ribosomal protein S18-alanine N-acetyltransferase [Aliidiomarina sp.]MCH8501447.1 ribosomal protein S18-alanine N-acetyltransferase [Aliidiomarina sp.]
MLIVTDDQVAEAHFSIEERAHVQPWSRNTFRQSTGAGYVIRSLYVMRQQQPTLVGYYVCHSVLDEVTLMNIAVDPDVQRQGIGRLLMDDLIARCSSVQGALQATVFLDVRESNHAAIQLYHAFGFDEVGRRVGYYPAQIAGECAETAIVMARYPTSTIAL